VYAVYAEQMLLMAAVAGAAGDVLADFEKHLDEPLPAELADDDLERLRRRKTADDNRAAHAKLVGFMQMPRKRELAP
jgi:hypothetical protein